MGASVGGGDLRSQLIGWMKKNYGEMLGKDADLLDKPGGMGALQRKYRGRFLAGGRKGA